MTPTEPAGKLPAWAGVPDRALARVATADLARELYRRLVTPGADLRGLADVAGVLSCHLDRCCNGPENRYSIRSLWEFFHLLRPPGRPPVPLEGRTCVEFGCGSQNPLARLFLMVLLGARRGIGIDLEAPQDRVAACHVLVRLATYLLTDPSALVGDYPVQLDRIRHELQSFDLHRMWDGDTASVPAHRLELRLESAAASSLEDGEADLVLSNSFLEHVPDPEAVVAELARVSAPGGDGVHQIDGLDHRIYVDDKIHPLDFLTIDRDEPIVHWANRVRPLQFRALFERHGFEVVTVQPVLMVEVDAAFRARLAPRFRQLGEDDLRVGRATFWVRKRAAP